MARARRTKSKRPGRKRHYRKRDAIDRFIDAIKELANSRKRKTVAVGIVSAIVSALLKAQSLTATFPDPWEMWANAALFIAIILIAIDFMFGGFSK